MARKKGTEAASARAPKKRAAHGGRDAHEAWTPEERAAMRDRAREMRAATTRGKDDWKAGEQEVLARIGAMPEPDRAMARRLHAIIGEVAPSLSPRTWYGMPAYARDGQVVCFLQSAHKFKTRYATLGFTDKAHLDEGAMWPTSFAIQALTPATEDAVRALVRRAAG